MRRTVTRGLVVVVACLPHLGSAAASEAGLAPASNDVLHRIVWDANEPSGIEVHSAERDGSDQRVIYRRARGFMLALGFNPRGTQVALAPFPAHERRAALLVVDVLTGKRRNLLEGLRRFPALGALGWSPTGRRLIFEGWVDEGGKRNGYLWSIRRDGTGLTRRTPLPKVGDLWVTNRHLAWTSHGIYYNGINGLMRLHGRSRLFLSRAGDPVASGNGTWIYLRRGAGERPARLWRMCADGSPLQRTEYRLGSSRAGYAMPVVPSRSGRAMLSTVSVDGRNIVVAHDATRAPRADDRRLDFLEGAYVLDWD